MPASGANFSSYSALARPLGRTYVHSTVARVVVDAYARLAHQAPGKVFMIGETGWKNGGRFRPHRTHQNGLSVDFMVPVIDANSKSVPLPTSAFNKFGYALEFDKQGRHENLRIDFEAIAAHLLALRDAAAAQDTRVALVIFDPQYLPMLFATDRGNELRALPFMQGKAWVRHDDHYHVDFAVACQPLSDAD